MIIIADSGSTKTDWALVNNEGKIEHVYNTQGLNPYFHNQEVVVSVLTAHKELSSVANEVNSVFFYGPGSSAENMKLIMREGLALVFPNAEITVQDDLTACAYSTYTGEPSISCIIGAGSNSCFFDGRVVTEEHPSLAFILGDEGSGSYFGKMLLRDYFYNQLPAEMHADFEATFNPVRDDMMRKIYSEPGANVYLASFMPFIARYADDTHVVKFIVQGMREFLDAHVKCFAGWSEIPVHFTGSVAYHFQHCLRAACDLEGVKIERVVHKPINNLVRYHMNYILKGKMAA